MYPGFYLRREENQLQHRKTAKGIVRILTTCVILFSLTIGNAMAGFAAGLDDLSGTDVTLMENCTADISENRIVVTDTDDNNDVWSSKLMLDSGLELTPGEQYKLSFKLSGDNGVGEFFFLKSNDIDARYTFNNEAGVHTVTFTAEDTVLYFGVQCGNIGKGNSVTVSNLSVSLVESGNGMLGMAMSTEAVQETDTVLAEAVEETYNSELASETEEADGTEPAEGMSAEEEPAGEPSGAETGEETVAVSGQEPTTTEAAPETDTVPAEEIEKTDNSEPASGSEEADETEIAEGMDAEEETDGKPAAAEPEEETSETIEQEPDGDTVAETEVQA